MARPLLRVKAALPALLLALLLAPNHPSATTAIPQPGADWLEVASSPWSEAAEAARRGDFEAARRPLAPLAAESHEDGLRARLVLGFYAHAAEEPELARRYLISAAGAVAPMEDWRLYLLSDSLRAGNDLPAARATAIELLQTLPDSPLRIRALELAADVARLQGDPAAAAEWIGLARTETVDADVRRRLALLAWDTALSHGDANRLREAARRLAVDHPLEAREVDLSAAFDGARPVWGEILRPGELTRRAENQLEQDLLDEALETLDAVPETERDNGWWLLRAEVLIDDHRGAEALELLADLTPRDPAESVGIAWRRSMAALDASRFRRGRVNLLTSRRDEMRIYALDTLRWIVAQGVDPESVSLALDRLFAELARDDDATEEALEALRALRAVDADETRGNEFLWELGWKAYTRRNLAEAMDRWRLLGELYPESSRARWGRYWTARSLEKLDRPDEAQAIYREIVASEATDFYRLHALPRLDDGPLPAAAPLQRTEPWPEDPRLDRAKLLSGLGLGELALIELEAYRDVAEPRAFHAEQARALAAAGRPRESIQAIRKTFPALGGARQGTVPREALELYYPIAHRSLVLRYAEERDLDPNLVLGMIRQESAFDAEATSWAGARGLMQIVPSTGRETARRLGLRFSTQKLTDPEFSIRLGTAYFRQVMDMFDDDVELALAGYNGGPYRLRRLWRQAGSGVEKDEFFEGLPIAESRTYVKRILLLSDSYRRLYGDRVF